MAEKVAYDKRELRAIIGAFKAMDEGAIAQARKVSNQLADFLSKKIIAAAGSRTKSGRAAVRIAEGVKVSKTSKIGEFSYGFASQKFSGGGTTKELWPGMEFGSKRFKQFPVYSGRFNRGGRGYFIYPTLRDNQRELVAQWEQAFNSILKEW